MGEENGLLPYIDHFEKAKGGKCICPNCKEPKLSINKKTGAHSCYSCHADKITILQALGIYQGNGKPKRESWEELAVKELTEIARRSGAFLPGEPEQPQDVTTNLECDDKKGKKEKTTLGQSALAARFCELNGDRFTYDLDSDQWYTYSDGCWKPCRRGVIEQAITRLVKQEGQSFKADLIRGAAYLCQLELCGREWQSDRNLLPLANGVLNIQTRELLPHSPDFNFRWQLPYPYNPAADCSTIQNWLFEAAGKDEALVKLLRAFLNAILLGRVDLQKYLELVGPGGTGKSTFIRLAMALVGTLNTFTTELKRLEQNRFEAAGIVGKRLIVITDSEHYAGTVSILKAITGQDSIPLERKYKDPDPEGLIPDALVIVASNETIQSSDYTSGLARRRLTIPFLNRIPDGQQRNLISWNGRRVAGELVEELPGLLNWVLALSHEEVTRTIKNATNDSPTLRLYKIETLLNSNPIADWLDNHVIINASGKTYIGTARKIRLSEGDKETGVKYWETYENAGHWLYANYCDFCLKVGNKPIGMKRFAPLLRDLLAHQLGIPTTSDKDRHGAYIQGISLRGSDDISPNPISGQLVCDTSQPETDDRSGDFSEKYRICHHNSDLSSHFQENKSSDAQNSDYPSQDVTTNLECDDKKGNFAKTPPSDQAVIPKPSQDNSSKVAHTFKADDRVVVIANGRYAGQTGSFTGNEDMDDRTLEVCLDSGDTGWWRPEHLAPEQEAA